LTFTDRSPDEIDIHVGRRIRMRRKLLGLSQSELADGLGLTFQQVQKYERGVNRLSASRLYQVARFLKTPISYYFDGLPLIEGDDGHLERERQIAASIATADGYDLATAFGAIARPDLQRLLVRLAQELARSGG
jgi:transcriptional regulator with XRE-family HTH domain